MPRAVPVLLLLVALIWTGPAAAAEPASQPATTHPAAGQSAVTSAKADLEPTRLTGKVKDAPAEKLFAEIAKLGNVTFNEKPNNLLTRPPLDTAAFSAEFDKQPLWDAIREACDTAKLHVGPGGLNSDRDAIGLIDGPMGACSIDGPVLVRVGKVDPLKDDKTVRVAVEVVVEPRLMPFASVGEVKIE